MTEWPFRFAECRWKDITDRFISNYSVEECEAPHPCLAPYRIRRKGAHEEEPWTRMSRLQFELQLFITRRESPREPSR